MDTPPESKETKDVQPAQSQEKLSPKGVNSMQGQEAPQKPENTPQPDQTKPDPAQEQPDPAQEQPDPGDSLLKIRRPSEAQEAAPGDEAERKEWFEGRPGGGVERGY